MKKMIYFLPFLLLTGLGLVLSPGCSNSTSAPSDPAPTATFTPTRTVTSTGTATITSTPTATATNTTQPTPSAGVSWSFPNPVGVAVHNSEVYVTDSVAGQVDKYDLSGTPVPAWTPIAVSGAGGIAVDGTGDIYVTDNSQRLYKFTSAGAAVTYWTTTAFIYGVAVDGSGNLYLSHPAGTVQKLDPTGTPVTQWSVANNPNSLAIHGSTLFMTTYSDGIVHTFGLSGTAGVTWSMGGYGGGLVVDSLGRVYVGDNNSGPIRRYDSSGNYQDQFGSGMSVYGMAVDPSDNIYVADYYNSLVRVFHP